MILRKKKNKLKLTWLQIRVGIRIIFFVISPQNICCGYSLEAPRRGASYEYHNIIALDKAFFNQKVSIFFLFLNENICCGYSLEAPRQGASNEYPQHMFSLRNKKTIYLIPMSYLDL